MRVVDCFWHGHRQARRKICYTLHYAEDYGWVSVLCASCAIISISIAAAIIKKLGVLVETAIRPTVFCVNTSLLNDAKDFCSLYCSSLSWW